MPRSTYYYYVKQLNKEDRYKEIKEQITAIYHENKGRYGYRRITMELHNRGYIINHKTVLKLMKQLGLQCFVRVRKYKSYKGEVGKRCDNLLKRNFKADKPNQKWVTDVTEFSLFGTKLYLSPIIDLFNGEVVSYNISERPIFYQVADMLEKAFSKIPDNISDYFRDTGGTELNARLAQIKNWYGIKDPYRPITPEMWNYARRHYVPSMDRYDNNMQHMFRYVTDPKKFLEWINPRVAGQAGAIGTVGFSTLNTDEKK